jgi:hypothetical protein
MGRKGIGRQKPKQNNIKPFSRGAANSSESNFIEAGEPQLVKSYDPGLSAPPGKGRGKPSAGSKKNYGKG